MKSHKLCFQRVPRPKQVGDPSSGYGPQIEADGRDSETCMGLGRASHQDPGKEWREMPYVCQSSEKMFTEHFQCVRLG